MPTDKHVQNEQSTDELLDPEGSGYTPEPPWDHEPFTYTGVLLVRMRADDPDTARAILAAAAHAALEADPFVVAVEGTSVARNPAKRRPVRA